MRGTSTPSVWTGTWSHEESGVTGVLGVVTSGISSPLSLTPSLVLSLTILLWFTTGRIEVKRAVTWQTCGVAVDATFPAR